MQTHSFMTFQIYEHSATKAQETAAISWLRFFSGRKCLVCFQQNPQTEFQGMYSSGFLFICKLLYDYLFWDSLSGSVPSRYKKDFITTTLQHSLKTNLHCNYEYDFLQIM